MASDQENFVVAFHPDTSINTVVSRYQQMGALDVGRLPNLSQVLSLSVFVVAMPEGFPKERMALPGVVQVDSEVEHGFFLPMPGFDPLPSSLIQAAPLGRFDLTLGRLATLQEFLASGDFEAILTTIQARLAWAWNRGGGTTILIIDTGIDGNRVPAHRRAGGWSDPSAPSDPWRDTFGHGTMCAMVAAANRRYNGFDGVAPDAKIFSLKPALGPSGGVLGTSVIKGLDYVLGLKLGPVVTNQSWGVFGCHSPLASCHVLAAQLVKALSRGAITVWAAGNNKGACGPDAEASLWCMNSLPEAISVGALDRHLQPQFYSSPGPGQ